MKDAELIKLSGVPSSTYHEFMGNKSKSFSSSNLWLIARALGVTTDYLLDPEAESPEDSEIRLTPQQKSAVAIFDAIGRLGWEEVAKRVDLWEKSFVQPFEEPEEIEGLIPAKPIAKPKGLKVRDMVPARPIDPPAKGE